MIIHFLPVLFYWLGWLTMVIEGFLSFISSPYIVITFFLHFRMVFSCNMFLCRFSLRGGVSGELQHSLKSFLGLFNAITAMHTWMLWNRMQLMCTCHSHAFSYSFTCLKVIFFLVLDYSMSAIWFVCFSCSVYVSPFNREILFWRIVILNEKMNI